MITVGEALEKAKRAPQAFEKLGKRQETWSGKEYGGPEVSVTGYMLCVTSESRHDDGDGEWHTDKYWAVVDTKGQLYELQLRVEKDYSGREEYFYAKPLDASALFRMNEKGAKFRKVANALSAVV